MARKLQQINYTRQLLSDIVEREDGNRRQKRVPTATLDVTYFALGNPKKQ
jgi:hypothetical protein